MSTLSDQIAEVIEKEPVAVFMKGTPEMVMCGNSHRALNALRAVGAPITTVDVLPDPRIRQELAEISGWPTIPQVFVKGELIGGADITEMARIETPAQGQAFIEQVHAACAAIRACPVPVIARINGWCLGAGLEIAAACDLRIAATTARFGMPEVRVGIPSVVEAALLPGLIGWGRTRRLLLLGETFDAAEMERWGLLERVADDLDAACAEWCALIAQAGPAAIRRQKALITAWEDLPLSQAVAAGIPAFAASWDSDEPRAMMADFLHRKR